MSAVKPVLRSPMLYGKFCEVELNRKIYRRVVRYSRADGLYIVIATVKYRYSDMEIAYRQNREGRS